MRLNVLIPTALLGGLAFSLLPACRGPYSPILDHEALLARQDWWDNRDWEWYEANIPFLETPDRELDATYYYRWELLTKHLVYGSPKTGYTFTEFIDRPFWSGSYGAISCPLGHQAYEVRWLKDRRIQEDFGRYWFETPGAQPRSYSNWYGDAMWATYEVTGDTAFLRAVYPHMQTQVAGWTEERWDPEHGMYRWVGAWDGMETNINSRLTDDEFGGGEGYRPTLNSYLYADMRAIARTAALFGDEEKAAEYRHRAEALKARVQEELWDPDREFFFHQFAFDEKDGIRARSLTYESGPYAGNSHGRELLGYVPWQFRLPDPGYEAAWQFLMDPEYFWAPFGPTGVEQGDPQFFVSPRCCVWSGNAWPYATAQTLTALANLLNDYQQDVVDRTDYWKLLQTYSLSHRRDGRPYIAEAADPFTGSWNGHNTFYHSEHYLHSGFVDQVISGLVGIRPRADDTLQVNPLAPEAWDYFALEGVAYHGHDLTVLWDRDGTRFERGAGLAVFLDGREVARRRDLGELRVPIPGPAVPERLPRLNNYAVQNDGGPFPFASASSAHPLYPPSYAVDGNRWYHPSPPNRWVAGGWAVSESGSEVRETPDGHFLDGQSPDEEGRNGKAAGNEAPNGQAPGSRSSGNQPEETWFQVDFGGARPLTRVQLYFLDDQTGPATEAVGEEESSGFPMAAAEVRIPIRPPVSFRLEVRREGEWVEVPGQERVPLEPAGRRANTVRFPEMEGEAIRVVMSVFPGATVGLTEVEAWGPDAPTVDEGVSENLALAQLGKAFPAVSASFTYQGDGVEQAVDGRISFTRYSRNRWTAYSSPNLSDWLEVDFGRLREIRRVELFLYGDGRGVAAPAEYGVQIWDGDRWLTAEETGRVPREPLAWARNVVELVPVRAEKMRVVFRHALPAAAGVSEIRVF